MPRPSDLTKQGVIYFIRSERQGAVKVGFATDTYTRMKTLQSGNPWGLDLMISVPATYGAELALHKALKAKRIRLEWYPDDAFMGYLANELEDISLDLAMGWLVTNAANETADSFEQAAAQIRAAAERNPLTPEHVAEALTEAEMAA